MAMLRPQNLKPLPSYYFSPSFRGAPLTPTGRGDPVYKTRKMEGALGGFFNVLLAGERASGSFLYAARKKVGFSEIDWIEKAEPGEYGYRRISPSEALGLRGYSDKFWTARGIASFALDVVLDPTTYIGVGLIGKAGKIGKMGITSLAGEQLLPRGGIKVGSRGLEFIAETEARGISRATAERKLVEYMGRSTSVQAEMMERTGVSAVKFMGRPMMKTSRVTDPLSKLWQDAPMLESRTRVAEELKTMFIPFHQLKKHVGGWAAKPFEEYYRKTGVGRSQWNKYVAGMAKDVPEELHKPIVRYAELGEEPTTNIKEVLRLGKQYQAETAMMAEREMAAGILEPGLLKEHYYARVPTEEAMRYTEKKMGKDFGAGLTREETVSKYIKTLSAGKARILDVDIFAAEEIMRKQTGVKQWYVFDPFESLQRRGVSSIINLESRGLLVEITSKMGFKAVPEIETTYGKAPTGARLPSLIKGFELRQQERAIFALRELVDTGGDVSKMKLPHVLQELDTRQIFGKVRPGGKTPKTWIRERYEAPVGEYHRYKREIWEIGAEVSSYESAISRELRRPIISRKDITGFEKDITNAQRGILHREEMIERLTTGLRIEGGFVGSELIDPAERAVLKYRKAYEDSLAAVPGRVASTKTIPPARTMWKGDELYELKGGYYIPSQALAEYQRRVPTTGWWTRQETKFKKTLTSIWPAFHLRNLYGILGWQNVLAGVGPRGYIMNLDIMRKTSPMMGKLGLQGDVDKLYNVPFMGKKTAAQLRGLAEEQEVYGVTGMIDVAATYSTKRSGLLGKAGQLYETLPQEAMVGIESVGRGALFWDRIMKGMPIPEASKDVEKFHFRYGQGALTEFESDKMRHAFLFYRWMRGNIPLQAQMSLEKPGLYAGLGKVRERSVSPEAQERLAPWQKERFGFAYDDKFVSLDLPFYEHPAMYFNPSQWGNIAFAATPAIKYPMGMLFGRDPATGRPIETWGERAEFTTAQFGGRFMYSQKEISKTVSGERPLSWTFAHQLGGVGVYEMAQAPMMTGMTRMPGVPSDLRKLGVSQDDWRDYKLAMGWKPQLTQESRMDIYQQHGGRCSVCGQPCSPAHPCKSRLIVPVELGGTNTPENTTLIHTSCSGAFSRNIAPLRAAQQEGLVVPEEFKITFNSENELWGVMDQWESSRLDDASLAD